MTEGQPRADEAPSPLRWDFAQLLVHGTARLARAHMISSSSIGQHKPRSMFQDLCEKATAKQTKESHIVLWRGWNIMHFPSVEHYGELALSPLSVDLLYLLCRQQQEADENLYKHTVFPPCSERLKVSAHDAPAKRPNIVMREWVRARTHGRFTGFQLSRARLPWKASCRHADTV